jgi:hypothetical protein
VRATSPAQQMELEHAQDERCVVFVCLYVDVVNNTNV